MKFQALKFRICVLLLVCTNVHSESLSGSQQSRLYDVDFALGVKIPMRDGVQLNANLYRPRGITSPVPAVFLMTPYINDMKHDMAMYLAKHGYNAAVVDLRGRGNSEGEPSLLDATGEDGYDVVEWLANQPWCDGKVGMWGGSIQGYAQWTVLKERPPHLKTIVPVASVYPGYDFPMVNNVGSPYTLQWLSWVSGKALNNNVAFSDLLWDQVLTDYYNGGKSFKDLPALLGNETTKFREWAEHPEFDEYWTRLAPSEEEYGAIEIPILTITGHYDDDQDGALKYFKDHAKSGSSKSIVQHYLVMGPWDHPGTRYPELEFEGVTVGDASLLDMKALHVSWYDWALKGGDKPEFLRDKISYYVIGKDEWFYERTLEDISSDSIKLYLSSTSADNDVFRSGRLNRDRLDGLSESVYVYDPMQVKFRPNSFGDPELYSDQSEALSIDGNGLVFHSDIFDENFDLVGSPDLSLWISIDVPDTDIYVSIYEIDGYGKSTYLGGDVVRARYRDSLQKPSFVVPGKAYQYQMNRLGYIGREIKTGNRLRLVINSFDFNLQRNYNGGGAVADESQADSRLARITVHHTEKYPSYLRIPVRK